MLQDALTSPDEADLHADVCIVGGGPAAMALAAEFDSHGQRDIRGQSKNSLCTILPGSPSPELPFGFGPDLPIRNRVPARASISRIGNSGDGIPISTIV